jgi:hypothetical protein
MKKTKKSTPLAIPYPKDGGFFILARAVFTDDELLKGTELLAWIWLISKAAYKPWKFKYKQSVIEIQRGEVVVSARYLAEALGWGKSAAGAFLKFLSSPEVGRLSVQRETPAGTVYLLVKYADYQLAPEGTKADTRTASRTVPGQTADKKKKVEETVTSKNHSAAGATAQEPTLFSDTPKGNRLAPIHAVLKVHRPDAPDPNWAVVNKKLGPLYLRHSVDYVGAQFELYMAATAPQFFSWDKFVTGFGSWGVAKSQADRSVARQYTEAVAVTVFTAPREDAA